MAAEPYEPEPPARGREQVRFKGLMFASARRGGTCPGSSRGYTRLTSLGFSQKSTKTRGSLPRLPTYLPQLLERVAQGEEFTITRHGKPVARLVPAVAATPKPGVRQVIEELKVFSKCNSLGDDTMIRELIEDGRRF